MVDYVIDGFMILRNKNIQQIKSTAKEKFAEKIIRLKKQNPDIPHRIPMDDLETILKYLTKKFGVFELRTRKNGVCYLGKLNFIDEKLLVVDNLDPKGKWSGKIEFKPSEYEVSRTIQITLTR